MNDRKPIPLADLRFLDTPPVLRARASVRLQFARQDARAGDTRAEERNMLEAAALENAALAIERRGMA